LNVCQITIINCYPVESDEPSAPDSILATEFGLNWNCNLDNQHESDNDSVADIDSDIQQDYGIKDPECPEKRDVSAAPSVPGLIWPTRKSN
jgi:hypothetical protein